MLKAAELVELSVSKATSHISETTNVGWLRAVIRKENAREGGPRKTMVAMVEARVAELEEAKAEAAKSEEVSVDAEAPATVEKEVIQAKTMKVEAPTPTPSKKDVDRLERRAKAEREQFYREQYAYNRDSLKEDIRKSCIEANKLSLDPATAVNWVLEGLKARNYYVVNEQTIKKMVQDAATSITIVMENNPESEGKEEEPDAPKGDTPEAPETNPNPEPAPSGKEDPISTPITLEQFLANNSEAKALIDNATSEQLMAVVPEARKLKAWDGQLSEASVGCVAILNQDVIKRYNNGEVRKFVPRFKEPATYVAIAGGIGIGLVAGKMLFGASAEETDASGVEGGDVLSMAG